MALRSVLRRGALVAAVLLSAAPLRSADDPIDAFPAETGVVLRLASPTDLTNKSQAFLKNAAPQFVAVAGQVGPGLGTLIGNPTMAGVDPARAWYVAVFAKPQGAPAILFAAPAAKADELKKAVGSGYSFADYENWVVYSQDAEAVKAVQARVGGEGKSVREAMPGALGQVFAAGEVGVFLNVPRLREVYQPQIDKAREQYAKLLDDALKANNPTMKAGMEYNRKVIETLLAAIDDLSGFAKSVTIGEKALTAEAVAVVKPGTKSAEFLAKQTTSDLPLLAKLPRGRLAYYGLSGDLSDLIAASTQLTGSLSPQNEEFKKRMQEISKFRFEEIAGEFELGSPEGGVYRGISLVKMDKPQEYLTFARGLMQAMGHIEAPGLQEDVTIKPEAETVEGVKVDVAKVVMTFDPNADPTGSSQKMMEILFGKDGMTQRLAVVDGLLVQGVGGPDVMAAGIKAARGQASGDETAQKAVDATRAGLGGKTNLLVLFDLPRALGGGLQLAIESKQLPLPIDPQAIANLNLALSYTGMTAAAGKEELRFRGVIPAEQVRGTVELFNVLQRATPGRGGAR